MAVSRLFLNLGSIGSGLLLFIDDLQWVDDGTLDVLAEIVLDVSAHPLLIVGTYRNNEVSEEHRLVRFKEWAGRNDHPVDEIRLESFDDARMRKLVSGLLHEEEDQVSEISKVILRKSKGNPFFAIEALKQLVLGNAVVLDHGRWRTDPDILDRIEISSSMVDLILQRISLLDDKWIALLSYAAIIGRKFDMKLLFRLAQDPRSRIRVAEEELLDIIDGAIQNNLLEEDLREKGKILFAHDRIKEAFEKGLGEEEKKGLHLQIARTLEELNREDVEEVVFDLAHHYIAGGDEEKALEYAFPAGEKAKRSFANGDALRYLKICEEILERKLAAGGGEDRDWRARLVKCKHHLGDVCLTVGNNDEAIEFYKEVLPSMETRIEQASIHKQICNALFKKGDWTGCEEYGRMGLSLLGERLPIGKGAVAFSTAKELLVHLLHSLFPFAFVRRSERSRSEKYKTIIWFYLSLNWMYLLSDVAKVVRSVLRMLNIAEGRIGSSKELGIGLTAYSTLCMAIPLFGRAARYNKAAMAMKLDLGDEQGVAQSLEARGYRHEWQGDYRNGITYLNQANDRFQKIGDMWEMGMMANGLLQSHYYLSEYDAAIDIASRYLEISRRTKNLFGIPAAREQFSMIYTEKGDYNSARREAEECLAISDEADLLSISRGHLNLGYAYLEMGDHRKAIESLEQAHQIIDNNTLLKQYSVHVYLYLADAYLCEYTASQGGGRVSIRRIRRLCRKALAKTRSWATYYGSALRVNAKLFSVIGRKRKAESLFRRSIEHCEGLGRRYEQAKGLLEYGRFLSGSARIEEARQKYEAAYMIFKEIGSEAYTRRAADMAGITEGRPSEESDSIRRLVDKRRLYSVIKVSQDMSSIMQLDVLLEKIMSVAIEVSGAQRGYLLIRNKRTNEYEVVVRKSIDEDAAEQDQFSMSIIKRMLETGEAVLATNAAEEYESRSVVKYELKSVLCIPIRHRDEILGICYLDNPLSSGVFTAEDIEIMKVIAGQAAISIENVRLYEMAIYDGLTKLVNRRHFDFLLQKESDRCIRYGRSFSLIMADIDNFKAFNDSFGHQAGDYVLERLGVIIKGLCRSSDIAARYGGEELSLILPETGADGAEVFAEKLRGEVEKAEVVFRGRELNVTISLGVAALPQHAKSQDALIRAADTALYASKEGGRNRVTVCNKCRAHWPNGPQ